MEKPSSSPIREDLSRMALLVVLYAFQVFIPFKMFKGTSNRFVSEHSTYSIQEIHELFRSWCHYDVYITLQS